MTDIVERLRSPEFADVAEKYLMAEAAAEIERLRAAVSDVLNNYDSEEADELFDSTIERLRDALEGSTGKMNYRYTPEEIGQLNAEIERLRAALNSETVVDDKEATIRNLIAQNNSLREALLRRVDEIERLRGDHDDYMVRANANVCDLNRESEQLRAALKDIAIGCGESVLTEETMRARAFAALRGDTP